MALMATTLDTSERAIWTLLFVAVLILLGMIGFAWVAAGKKRRNRESSGINYEVFLSFRGTDTRKGFADHLYSKLLDAGIQVFEDDKNLSGGEEIEWQLKEAIKGSKISIVIFTKDYASSKSCLMEAEHMWECRISKGQIIIPIFYDIGPYDVKRQDGDFKTSFCKHEKDGVNPNAIKRWKTVLQKIGGLSAFCLENVNGGNEAQLIKEVVRRVSQVLKKHDQKVTDELVGIDLHVQEMMRKLGVVYSDGQAIQVCGKHVRVVGICGVPGVGKTTLAKIVFNKMHMLFDGSSFVEDINSRGVMFSQEMLIADFKKGKSAPLKSSGEGSKEIASLLRNAKVLIVLDDVREDDQIKALVGKLTWFGPGSRIIVTTNTRNVLNHFDDGVVDEYEVEPMKHHHALQLFCKHAFHRNAPQDVSEHNSLSIDIVKAIGGIPLAIVLLASYVFCSVKDIRIWTITLESQKTHQGDVIDVVLMAIYESLDDRTREIFLDVACFFIGKDKRILTYMWEACGYHPASGIEHLRDMYLLEIGENNELRMHDLLTKFGRNLVKSKVLHKRSRVWNQNDALSILRDGKGTESVESIDLPVEKGCPVCFPCEELRKLSNLRYLRLDRANIQGNAENLLPNLRWLDWRGCRSISELRIMHLKKLVILDLSWSLVTNDLQIWSQIMQKVEELKVLNLQGCALIGASLNFPAPINLEILILEDCTLLSEIGPFIRNLKNLSSLNLRNCRRVERLPEELNRMDFLRELLIDGTGIRNIHFRKGSLENLEIISARDCPHLQHIFTIGSLRNLLSLDLDGTAIEGLPCDFEFPQKLRRLSLRNCWKLYELPTSIGKLKQLEVMDLSHTAIKTMPSSVKKLRNLKTLKMECTPLQKFPEEIVNLSKLEEIDFSFCSSLEGNVRSDITGLSFLRILRLSSSYVAALPKSICHLSHLQALDILDCNELHALPKLPASLLNLRWGSRNIIVPDLSYLTNLKELVLIGVMQPKAGWLMGLVNLKIPNINWITGLPSLQILQLSLSTVNNFPGNFSALAQLQELSLSYMKELDLTQLPSSLLTLHLNHCKIQKPKFSSLKYLSELELANCDLAEIDGLEDLTLLQVLNIFQCSRITHLNEIKNLKSLRVLNIDGRTCLNELNDGVEVAFESMDTMKDAARPQAAGMETSEWNFAFAAVPNVVGSDGPRMKKMEEEARERAADMKTSDRNKAITAVQNVAGIDDYVKEITDLLVMEGNDESMEKLEDEVRQQATDMETSDSNYAIAAVQNIDGIDDRVKRITDLLEMEGNDEVRIIGIYGTDGIGKTTLAKAVYDRISSCFNSCSFLAEVEETTQNPRGIQSLQTKLIRDILERDCEDPSFDETIELFLDIFRERKVLIVVDGVEKQSHLHAIVGEQLHWFGPGSRIIVTTENEEILKEYDPEKAHTYTVSALDDGQAFELFCRHAFRMQSSMPEYNDLANCIVNATEKLPLAVEVIGSFLRGKSIQEWEKMEKSMKLFTMSSQKTTVGCEEILDICYKELDQQQKDIFQDIACFISGVDVRIASFMWPNSYLLSSNCILMPLAKIGENNELQMHRLLRCFGKRILNQEGSKDPIQRKFYIQDMVPKAIISGEKEMEDVEALCFDLDDHASCIFTPGDFGSMPDIRFLKLDGAKLSGNFAGAFPSLRWLCWQRCPLDFHAINLVLREVVILDLSGGKVTEDWGGWSEIKMEKLKVLNLTGCSDLLITPDFSDYKYLEILILERCSCLVKLDPSIRHLKSLVSLNLKFCSQLNGLPVELGCMTSMKELFIDGTSVREIPISIGNLKQLEILSGFKCFPLTYLPSSISYLTALSKLSLDGARITELPRSLGELLNLRRLSLRDCRYMEELPDSIGKMGSLEELDISATSISVLPDSIRNLQSLRVLRMDSSFIGAFPRAIGNLTKLEELHASGCRSLKGAIPGVIKELHHLRSLTLGHSSISSLPTEISTISGLLTLDLLRCNEIEELPKLPPSLICLCVSSKRMKAIPLLENLRELEELCLSDGDLKSRRPPSKQPMPESYVKQMIDKPPFSISFPKLRKLELSLSQIIKLKFEPMDIAHLEILTLPGLSHKEVSELPKTLSVFELYHSAVEEIEGLEGLEALKRLDISNCKIQNLNGIGQLTSLRSLILSDCGDLNLPDLSNLKLLKILEIRRCKMICQIEGLEKLTSLEKLNISECPAESLVQVRNAMKHVMARSPVM